MSNYVYLYIVCITVIFESSSKECPHYYLLLEEDSFGMAPITLSQIGWSKYDSTNMKNQTRDDINCVIELSCASIETHCDPVAPKKIMGSHVDVIDSLEKKSYTTKTTTSTDIITISTDITTTSSDIITTSSDITTTATSIDITANTEFDTTTSKNESVIFNTAESAAATNEEDGKRVAKTAAIAVAGVAGTSAVGYFVVKKIIHLMQQGVYRIPA